MTGSNSSDSTSPSDSLQTVTKGASLFYIGRLLSNIISFIFHLILTRGLGVIHYGVFTYGRTIVGFFFVLSRLGTGKALLRFIPSADENRPLQNWYAIVAYITAFTGSVIMASFVFLLADEINLFTLESPQLVKVLRILSVTLPFITLINVTNSLFRGLEKMKHQVAVKNIFRPVINVATASLALLLNYSLIGVSAAYVSGTILTFVIGIWIVQTRTAIRLHGSTNSGSLIEFYNFSLPLTVADLGQKLYTRMDILMVGFFLTGSAVGIYRAAALVSTFLKLPLTGVNQLFPSVASDLHLRDDREELKSLYQTLSRWIVSFVALPATATIIYNQKLLRIFGEDFQQGGEVLMFFAVAQLVSAAVGPSGYLLMMTDHQYLTLTNQWTMGVLNVIGNYLLIKELGLMGAAVATAGTILLINILRLAEVWHFEQMSPITRSYWKPISAGVVAAFFMQLVKVAIEGWAILIIGTAGGFVIFIGCLYLFGIEEKDRRFFRDVFQKAL